jgi:hypothetical protein
MVVGLLAAMYVEPIFQKKSRSMMLVVEMVGGDYSAGIVLGKLRLGDWEQDLDRNMMGRHLRNWRDSSFYFQTNSLTSNLQLCYDESSWKMKVDRSASMRNYL